jgi:hypothetical protein
MTMQIRGVHIKKRYIALAVLALLMLPRCVQMRSEQAALEKEMAAGGFEYEWEMRDIKALGYSTKKDYERFIETTPIPSADGESVARCSAVASVWEERELSAKEGATGLRPATIGSVLYDDLGDHAVGKTTYKVVSDRRDHLKKTYEERFGTGGAAALKPDYLACHAKFAKYVLGKCGATGVCKDEEPAAPAAAEPAPAAADSGDRKEGGVLSSLLGAVGDIGRASPAKQGGQILQQSLRAPASYNFVSGDVIWEGKTKAGEPAYVVRVAYDAQNGFGALLRGCAIVAYRETSDGQLAWSQSTGVDPQVDPSFCQTSVPASTFADYAKTFAEMNFGG